MRTVKLLAGIPFFLFSAVMIVNLKTGWIFSIGEGNTFQRGPLDAGFFLPQCFILFYLFLSLIRMYRINHRLAVPGLLLILASLVWELWVQPISSKSLIFTLFILFVCLYVMNHPISEEAS